MDIQTHHINNKHKADERFLQLQKLDVVAKSKMWKFYRNVSRAWIELDKEYVNCRRIGRFSATYTTLEKEYYECITVFDQWILMAALMY